jgi:hypothetical protein
MFAFNQTIFHVQALSDEKLIDLYTVFLTTAKISMDYI